MNFFRKENGWVIYLSLKQDSEKAKHFKKVVDSQRKQEEVGMQKPLDSSQ